MYYPVIALALFLYFGYVQKCFVIGAYLFIMFIVLKVPYTKLTCL